MIKLSFYLLSAFIFAACSSSSDSKPAGAVSDGNVSVLEKSIRGQWISDCSRNQRGNYLQKIKMGNGTGSVLLEYMQNQDCTGALVRTEGPAEFTYVSGAVVGESTEVTLTFKNRPAVQSQIKINGSLMAITIGNETGHYHKLGGTENPAPADNDFDRAAMGTWKSTTCFPGQNNTTYQRLLIILGHGHASVTNLVFANTNCSGNSQAEAAQEFQFTVDNYANGGGQITINGEPSDVIISATKLSVNSASGSVEYDKQ